jgi:hypothetical protein
MNVARRTRYGVLGIVAAGVVAIASTVAVRATHEDQTYLQAWICSGEGYSEVHPSTVLTGTIGCSGPTSDLVYLYTTFTFEEGGYSVCYAQGWSQNQIACAVGQPENAIDTAFSLHDLEFGGYYNGQASTYAY